MWLKRTAAVAVLMLPVLLTGCAEPEPDYSPPGFVNDNSGYDAPVPAGGDLDCADINGPVAISGSDPHGLDADNDGIGCE